MEQGHHNNEGLRRKSAKGKKKEPTELVKMTLTICEGRLDWVSISFVFPLAIT